MHALRSAAALSIAPMTRPLYAPPCAQIAHRAARHRARAPRAPTRAPRRWAATRGAEERAVDGFRPDEPRPVAILWGWLGSSERHINKYAAVWESLGVRTVVVRPGYLETAVPFLGRAAAKGRVEALGRALQRPGGSAGPPEDESRPPPVPIIMHAFSNTGFMAWGGLAHAALAEAEREEGEERGLGPDLAAFSAPVEAMLRRWEALGGRDRREARARGGGAGADEALRAGGDASAAGGFLEAVVEGGRVELRGWGDEQPEPVDRCVAPSASFAPRHPHTSPLAALRVSLGPLAALRAALPYLVPLRRPPRRETLSALGALSRVRAGVFDSAPTLDPSGATLARGLLSALLRTDGPGLEARGRLTEAVEAVAEGYAQTRAASSRLLEVSRAWSAAAPHDLTYLYSQEDHVIPARDVVAAARVEAARGRRVALERWGAGAHVDLLRKDPRRYLDVCARVLRETRQAWDEERG